MTLSDYIKSKGGTATLSCAVLGKLAKRAKCTPGTLHLIVIGCRNPSWRLAGRISDATGGAVTREVLRPDVYGGGK